MSVVGFSPENARRIAAATRDVEAARGRASTRRALPAELAAADHEGFLCEDLDASTDDGQTERTAYVEVWHGEGPNWAKAGYCITAVNRQDGLSLPKGTYVWVRETNGEFRPVAWDEDNQKDVVTCCGTTAPPTTTSTTTTEPPCEGTCVWEWLEASKSWSPQDDGCSTGCVCLIPTFCGQTDGQKTQTFCATSANNPPICTTCNPNTTTTTGDPATSTTTTLNPACGGGGCTYYVSSTGDLFIEDNCFPTCDCLSGPPAGMVPCTTYTVPCKNTTTTSTTTTTLAPCAGECKYECVLGGTWFNVYVGCTGDGPCDCAPPSSTCSCGAVVFVPCTSGTSTTDAPTTTGGPTTTSTTASPPPCVTTSTTQPPNCSPLAYCEWLWNNCDWVNVAAVACTNNCPCNQPPPYAGTEYCEYARTPCGFTTTTTTTAEPTTSTTTTTAEPTTTTTGEPTTTTGTTCPPPASTPCPTTTTTTTDEPTTTTCEPCTGDCLYTRGLDGVTPVWILTLNDCDILFCDCCESSLPDPAEFGLGEEVTVDCGFNGIEGWCECTTSTTTTEEPTTTTTTTTEEPTTTTTTTTTTTCDPAASGKCVFQCQGGTWVQVSDGCVDGAACSENDLPACNAGNEGACESTWCVCPCDSNPAGEECSWQCRGGVWVLSNVGCCAALGGDCNNPPAATCDGGNEGGCDVSDCDTTTTPACEAASCHYECQGDVWVFVNDECSAGCDCPAPPGGNCEAPATLDLDCEPV